MLEEKKTERVTTMMTPSEVKAIDDWSFARRIYVAAAKRFGAWSR
jgi:hypothetical protein